MSFLKRRTPATIKRGDIAAPAPLTAPTTVMWKFGFVSFLQTFKEPRTATTFRRAVFGMNEVSSMLKMRVPSIFISMNSFAKVLNRIEMLSPSTALRTRAMHCAIRLERDGWCCGKRWYHPPVRIRIGVLRVGTERPAATASIVLDLAMISLRPPGMPQHRIAAIQSTRSCSNSGGNTVFDLVVIGRYNGCQKLALEA
ncbi:hypothetical protein Pcac1_g12427 [Phytophthora cactorum]|nr:hypothetical protein Pcac1_g12427 [Phytophthora cactorum]